MRRLLWPLLLIAATAAATVVLVPTFTIHPFRPQTTHGVELSYALKRAAPLVTAIALAVVLASALLLWGGARRWWRRGVIVLLVGVTGLVTWFARQNHFEWMFNPLPRPSRRRAEAAGFVVERDMVLAVDVNGEPSRTRSARSAITISSTTSSEGRRSSPRIERSVTPVWCGSRVDGRTLTFRLDRHQQPELHHAGRGDRLLVAAGHGARPIAGPLKGKHLTHVPHDEVTFGMWKARESGRPRAKPDERVEARRLARRSGSVGWQKRGWSPRCPRDPRSRRAR